MKITNRTRRLLLAFGAALVVAPLASAGVITITSFETGQLTNRAGLGTLQTAPTIPAASITDGTVALASTLPASTYPQLARLDINASGFPAVSNAFYTGSATSISLDAYWTDGTAGSYGDIQMASYSDTTSTWTTYPGQNYNFQNNPNVKQTFTFNVSTAPANTGGLTFNQLFKQETDNNKNCQFLLYANKAAATSGTLIIDNVRVNTSNAPVVVPMTTNLITSFETTDVVTNAAPLGSITTSGSGITDGTQATQFQVTPGNQWQWGVRLNLTPLGLTFTPGAGQTIVLDEYFAGEALTWGDFYLSIYDGVSHDFSPIGGKSFTSPGSRQNVQRTLTWDLDALETTAHGKTIAQLMTNNSTIYWIAGYPVIDVNGTMIIDNIRLVTPAPTTPPTLAWAKSGSNLNLSWTNSGFKLQGQTNGLATGLRTNWSDYPGGGTSPVSVPLDPANGATFFRLAPQ